MQMLVLIGLFYFVKEVKLFISIVLVLNTFLKKSKNLSGIKTLKFTFFEYKQTIQQCVVNFALDLLILCLHVTNWLILLVCFLLITLKRMKT